MFQPARQTRVFQDVVDQVQEAIFRGKLAPGDRLPAERELVEIFATSRGTLREALRVLEQKGLIEIRLGTRGGAVVRKASTRPVSESLALLIRSRSVSLEHLTEFREQVEGTVTALAARRADPAQIDRLRALLAQARRHAARGPAGWEAFVRVDEKIHMQLARATGNPIYAFVLRSVHDNIEHYYDRFLTGSEAELSENLRDLEQIVDAVADADIEAARRLARGHVRRFSRTMQNKKRAPYPDIR